MPRCLVGCVTRSHERVSAPARPFAVPRHRGGAQSRTRSSTRRSAATAKRCARCSAARADVNVPQADGTTALHLAVRANDVDLVKTLLGAGANAKATNRYGIAADHAGGDQRQRRGARCAAEGRRKRQDRDCRRRTGAVDRGADRQRGRGEAARRPRRRRQRARALVRRDRRDVGRRRESRRCHSRPR